MNTPKPGRDPFSPRFSFSLIHPRRLIRRRAQALDGRWILDFDREDGRVQLTIKRSSTHGNWNSSSGYEIDGIPRPERAAGSPTPKPASFELARDAGTIRFEGELDESGGSGRFQFAANPEFDGFWKSTGSLALTTDSLFAFTLHDISRRFIEDLRSLGYEHLPAERLIAMRIHGVTPEFIRELKALGYDRLPAEELITMRIHGATQRVRHESEGPGLRPPARRGSSACANPWRDSRGSSAK